MVTERTSCMIEKNKKTTTIFAILSPTLRWKLNCTSVHVAPWSVWTCSAIDKPIASDLHQPLWSFPILLKHASISSTAPPYPSSAFHLSHCRIDNPFPVLQHSRGIISRQCNRNGPNSCQGRAIVSVSCRVHLPTFTVRLRLRLRLSIHATSRPSYILHAKLSHHALPTRACQFPTQTLHTSTRDYPLPTSTQH